MATSRSTGVKTDPQPSDPRSPLNAARTARPLAPEDIRRGDFVALLDEEIEIPSFWWHTDAALLPPDLPVRLRLIPRDEAVPLKVRQVCLPFVLAKHPVGNTRTLDVRRMRLARLDRHYATAA